MYVTQSVKTWLKSFYFPFSMPYKIVCINVYVGLMSKNMKLLKA